jgi:hypothetical protein
MYQKYRADPTGVRGADSFGTRKERLRQSSTSITKMRVATLVAGLIGSVASYGQPNIIMFLAGAPTHPAVSPPPNRPPLPHSIYGFCAVTAHLSQQLIVSWNSVCVDDIGWSDFGYFGMDLYGATPMIDTLATQGVRLNCVYGQTACTPGRAAFLTGEQQRNPYPFRAYFGCRVGVTQEVWVCWGVIGVLRWLRWAGGVCVWFLRCVT